MLMGDRYSTSPCSGVAATTPVPAAAVEFAADDVEFAAVAPGAFPFALFFFALSSVPSVRPAKEFVNVSIVDVVPGFAAFIASRSPGGRGTLYFRYALINALVPAPGDRPLKAGFGTRSTIKLRFCTPACWGAARANVARARRRRVCKCAIEGIVRK